MYKIWTYITDPVWNNEFSYQERIALWSVGKIFVPSLITWSLDDLEEWSEIVFEEALNWKLISCTWLKHFVQLEYEWIPIYIVDNHNHALTFWIQKQKTPLIKWSHTESRKAGGETKKDVTLIHIDQHSDSKPNSEKLDGDRENFVYTKTNVGNFITGAVNSWIVNKVIQVRTDYTLQQLQTLNFELWTIIVDIDVDFRTCLSNRRVDKEITPEDIQIIRSLIKKAKLVTIATSPYFIDQKKAIGIIKKILL
jgi:hypothetical protein